MTTIPAPVTTAAEHARRELGLSGELLAGWAPGRVNLIGEHTDYNGGFVLPVAIERVVALVGQQRADGVVRLYSAHHGEQATFAVDNPPTAAQTQDVPLWARYVAGAVGELRAAGLTVGGFDAAIAGDVPLGGGMSSSAALLIATLTWLNAAFELAQEPLELARIGQRAETRGAGVQVGILDQAASVLGKPGQAVLIDCRTLDYRYIAFDLPDVGLLICETGVERQLAESGYNTRVAECKTAVAAFAAALHQEGDERTVTDLRDITLPDYDRLAGYVSEPARRRARHVITENGRTLDAEEALAQSNAAWFGQLIMQSHASLRDDYEVSIPELDALVQIATRAPGALGARLIGAGFGGGVLILAPLDQFDAIESRLRAEYPRMSGRTPVIHRLRPAGGPGTAGL